MKPLFYIVLAGAVMSGCSSGGGKGDGALEINSYRTDGPALSASDTASRADTIVEWPPVSSQGIGPVRLGMTPASLPRRLPFVYDTIMAREEIVEDEKVTFLQFMLGDRQMLTAEASGMPPKLSTVSVVVPGPAVVVGGRRFGVGSRSSVVARQPGVRAVGAEDGDWLEWRGVWLALDPEADTVASLVIMR